MQRSPGQALPASDRHLALPDRSHVPLASGRRLSRPARPGSLFESGAARLHPGSAAELARIWVLMARYRDIPMDLADASVVAAAETLERLQIFTVDRHFFGYRTVGGRPFELVP